MFNEIVIKASVSLSQIKRIENYSRNRVNEYYFYLTYPPKFYVALLKPDVGCDDGFIRSW